MNCYEFEQNISAFIEGDLKRKQKEKIISHKGECLECSTKIDKVSYNQTNFQKTSILSLMKNYKKTFENIYISETKKNNGINEIQKTIFELSQIQ